MDDYYSLLGIESDATVDDIRGAYRDRKDGLDTSSEMGRADAVKLNKAWNVLSDPYQRGRYDQQRDEAAEDGTLAADADLPVASAGRNGSGSRPAPASPRQARQQAARDARAERLKKAATIKAPPGTHFPTTKPRVTAMVIDLLVMFVIFIALSQFGANSLMRSQKPDVVHKVDALDTQISDQNKIKSDADKRVTADKKANNTAAQATDQKASDDAKAKVKDLTTQHDKEYSKLNAYLYGGVALSFFLGYLYLAIPSAISGRTLGKRFQHLKTLREDGSPLGWTGAFLRYGIVVGVTVVLFLGLRLGPLGVVVTLVGVTTWMRNPNMQGLHDRFAHTIVVSDATS
jgi:uncharacterized RDD family membrane protein YckC